MHALPTLSKEHLESNLKSSDTNPVKHQSHRNMYGNLAIIATI